MHASTVKKTSITQPRTFKGKKNLFDAQASNMSIEKQSRRSSAMKTSQRGGTTKKKRSRFPEPQYQSEDIGPGAYNPDKGLEAIAPRSPSPDLKHSKPYKFIDDPSQGPAAYSPQKDFVLIENPKWTFPGKYKKEGPPEPT